MRLFHTFLCLLPLVVNAQIDLPGDDTLKKLPLFEMTNKGISRTEFFQEDVHFVIVLKSDSSVHFEYGTQNQPTTIDTIYIEKSELFNPNQIDDFEVSNYCEYRDEKNTERNTVSTVSRN